MNKNRILAVLILFALLITCAGVSFASSDLDDLNIDDSDIDDYLDEELDDDLSDDSNDELDDESEDDLDDEDYLDDEDESDDDYEDDFDDEDYLDDDEEYDDEDDDWDYDDWDDDDFYWDFDNETGFNDSKTFFLATCMPIAMNCNENAIQYANAYSASDIIDNTNLEDDSTVSQTNKTDTYKTDYTNVVEIEENNILAFLALIILCLVAII